MGEVISKAQAALNTADYFSTKGASCKNLGVLLMCGGACIIAIGGIVYIYGTVSGG